MAKKQPQQALVAYDEELARLAQEAADQEAGTGGGQFFSIKGGNLSLGGAPIPNNEVAVVVVDAIKVNARYEGDFDPDNPASPTCYAFGYVEEQLVPHDQSERKEHENCAECPLNQFGTADKGRGKACKNTRRLACLSAGDLDPRTRELALAEPDDLAKGQLAFLNVPPTSIAGWAAYVKKLNATIKRHPLGVVTKIAVVPDQKTQVRVTFELISLLEGEHLRAALSRVKEAKDAVAQPFPKFDAAASEKPTRGKTQRPTRGARRF